MGEERALELSRPYDLNFSREKLAAVDSNLALDDAAYQVLCSRTWTRCG